MLHQGVYAILSLKLYYLQRYLFDWFHSYLTEREQRVVIKDASSSFTTILGGVPQSSVPAPLLFIIYINDIADKIHLSALSFGDEYKRVDTILFP
jgi:hypothetical protein